MSNVDEYKKIRIRENIRLLKYSDKFLKENFEEYIFINYYKIKNYFKLLLSYLGM